MISQLYELLAKGQQENIARLFIVKNRAVWLKVPLLALLVPLSHASAYAVSMLQMQSRMRPSGS